MRFALIAATLVAASGVALAQTSPTTSDTAGTQTPSASPNQATQSNNPAVAPSQTQAQTAPAAGRNSFTQRQAASRIATAGYTNVSGLKKDNHGIWRATAEKDGNKVNVSLDYRGNVLSQ